MQRIKRKRILNNALLNYFFKNDYNFLLKQQKTTVDPDKKYFRLNRVAIKYFLKISHLSLFKSFKFPITLFFFKDFNVISLNNLDNNNLVLMKNDYLIFQNQTIEYCLKFLYSAQFLIILYFFHNSIIKLSKYTTLSLNYNYNDN